MSDENNKKATLTEEEISTEPSGMRRGMIAALGATVLGAASKVLGGCIVANPQPGDALEHGFVGGEKGEAGGFAGGVGFEPAVGIDAPAVARGEAGAVLVALFHVFQRVHAEVAFVLLRAVAVGAGTFEQGLHLFHEVHFVSGKRDRRGQRGQESEGTERVGGFHGEAAFSTRFPACPMPGRPMPPWPSAGSRRGRGPARPRSCRGRGGRGRLNLRALTLCAIEALNQYAF